VLVRDYAPPPGWDPQIELIPGLPPNPQEQIRADAEAQSILESDADRYFDGPHVGEAVPLIKRVLAEWNLPIAGHVVDLASATGKLAAIVSQSPRVDRVTCIEFSDGFVREIAPRVIGRLGGDPSKIDFLVGDMNRLPELGLHPDWVLGYYAFHHLADPFEFFADMHPNIGSGVLSVREPALPRITLPTTSTRAFLHAQAAKREAGDFERNYTVSDYIRMGRRYHVDLRHLGDPRPPRPLLRRAVSRFVWTHPLDISVAMRK
jgi:SAM-dependent methyltransferase